jgi:hypothetical protein
MTEKWSGGWNPALDAWVMPDGSLVAAADIAAGAGRVTSFESFTARVRQRQVRVSGDAVRSGRERLGE